VRVLPQVARSIVFITIAKDMANLYHEMSAQLAGGDTTLLAETHAVSAGLKSYVSQNVVDGTEILRRACGGHGFMDAAGIGRIFARELPSVTYEGKSISLLFNLAAYTKMTRQWTR
jgi:acyl-CoA oxidase